MTPPEVFAEYDDVRTARQFVRLDESPPEDWTETDERWHFEACLDPEQLLSFTGPAEDLTARGVCADGLENVASAIAPVDELGKRERADVAAVLAVEQLHQRPLSRIRERSHENGVHDAENGARRAHPESDSQGHDHGEAGGLPDGPKCVADVLEHAHAVLGRRRRRRSWRVAPSPLAHPLLAPRSSPLAPRSSLLAPRSSLLASRSSPSIEMSGKLH